jgi:SAM-dependent methyltransferase
MEWFDKFFDKNYNKAYIHLDKERTEKDCNFIREMLNLQVEHDILDIPCGFGRHAIQFTKDGYKITGMEYHPDQIDEAKQNMQKEGVTFPLVQADMRNIPHKNRYDRLYNYFTSFGYFSDEENEKTIGEFHKALKPGGLVLIELANRDYFLRECQGSSVQRLEDEKILLQEHSFDSLTSVNNSTQILIENNKVVNERKMQHRLYSPHEIIGIFKKYNFKILKVCDADGMNISVIPKRIIVVAEK